MYLTSIFTRLAILSVWRTYTSLCIILNKESCLITFSFIMYVDFIIKKIVNFWMTSDTIVVAWFLSRLFKYLRGSTEIEWIGLVIGDVDRGVWNTPWSNPYFRSGNTEFNSGQFNVNKKKLWAILVTGFWIKIQIFGYIMQLWF